MHAGPRLTGAAALGGVGRGNVLGHLGEINHGMQIWSDSRFKVINYYKGHDIGKLENGGGIKLYALILNHKLNHQFYS